MQGVKDAKIQGIEYNPSIYFKLTGKKSQIPLGSVEAQVVADTLEDRLSICTAWHLVNQYLER